MPACLIFNPTAKGDKARRFRSNLDQYAGGFTLKMTTAAGDARRLAVEAVGEGFDCIIAAGGDGTVNETLNGIASTPGGLAQARFGVIPLGTVNVFARELSIPFELKAAWDVLHSGRVRTIDLPWVEHGPREGGTRRYFAQLAGAGLDARSIERVSWKLKKKVGPLAYVWAGLGALLAKQTLIEVVGRNQREAGQLVLIGNGRLYGGDYRLVPAADLTDGLLDVLVFPKVNLGVLALCGPSLLLRGSLPASAVRRFQAREFELSSSGETPFEVDGEWGGKVPARFGLDPLALRVMTPA